MKVLQFNIWQECTCIEGGFDALVQCIDESGADLVFLQEIRNYEGHRFIPRLVEALALKGKHYYALDSSCDSGVLSLLPIEEEARPWEGIGSVHRTVVRAGDRLIALYSAHLDYTRYACYLPRGYDGNTWERLPYPVVSTGEILKMNRASGRDDTIRDFIRRSRSDIEEGMDVILAGDFNEPSHLDWGWECADLWDHNGAIVPWDCSKLLEEASFADSYRVVHPDPLTNPGFTFPSDNPSCAESKLTWAPLSDERERIDFIYYYSGGGIEPVESEIWGPKGYIVKGERTEDSTPCRDLPQGRIWPSDHKAVLSTFTLGRSGPSVEICNPVIPAIVDRERNIICEICIDSAEGTDVLQSVSAKLSGIDPAAVKNLCLIYTGTASALMSRTSSYILQDQFNRIGSGQDTWRHPAFAVQCAEARCAGDGSFILKPAKPLVKGRNYFYLSFSPVGGKVDLSSSFTLDIRDASISKAADNGLNAKLIGNSTSSHRYGIALKNHIDDGVFSYRIPGLVTTPKGTLIASYDIRHTSANDLQDNIDVGISRSTDGGRTWEKTRTVVDMGEWGGLPEGQNGCGDASMLVDGKTGNIFVCALWTHGLGNRHAFYTVGDGYDPISSGQLLMVKSTDDGKSWSRPVNITRQVKRPEWRMTLQGPGRGITMQDGTLVFPLQCLDPNGVPSSLIMYSKDGGETWHSHERACPRTTEAQVSEIAPGVLMLNCRNDRRQGRVVCITEDLGRTWTTHPSSGSLKEPVCMAGLLNIPASENIYGRDILLFSNPATASREQGRNHICIKASLDGGLSWKSEDCLLLDQEEGWGYSCLSPIGHDKVGILYEGSTAHLVFQQIKLSDIVHSIPEPAELSADAIYSDNMVFQQGVPLLIKGRALPGRTVRVMLGASSVRTKADRNGRWEVAMPALKAGVDIPFRISDGVNTISYANVAAGEVWLCSGQSNMAYELRGTDGWRDEQLNDPLLRFYRMDSGLKTWGLSWDEESAARVALGDFFLKTGWRVSDDATAPLFSAVGYHFGKMLRDSLDVPVGLILNAVDGTTTESFVSRDCLEKVMPGFCEGWFEDPGVMAWAHERAKENMANFKGGFIRHPFMPGYLFDCGIRPLQDFPIKGAIWYQGESNAENIPQHEVLFKTMVQCWSEFWHNGSMPLYFVQLSSIERPTWPEFRNSQRLLAEQLELCGMAVSSDLGHPTDVHPTNKKPVGQRLARLALHNDYGFDLVCEGPCATGCRKNADGSLCVEFDCNLKTSDGGDLRGFTVCFDDGSTAEAQAFLSGDSTVTVLCDVPGTAVRLRYAWKPYTDANLVNSEGLPASTFEMPIYE
ncbi:MAG: exo-alpha-sialidase [Candidatus Cryptobacteroides sp.]